MPTRNARRHRPVDLRPGCLRQRPHSRTEHLRGWCPSSRAPLPGGAGRHRPTTAGNPTLQRTNAATVPGRGPPYARSRSSTLTYLEIRAGSALPNDSARSKHTAVTTKAVASSENDTPIVVNSSSAASSMLPPMVPRCPRSTGLPPNIDRSSQPFVTAYN